MAGQRTQLTVERVRKKGPAPAWIVGFCSLPQFAPPSELLLQMGLSEWKRAERGRREAGLVCCKNVHLGHNHRFSLTVLKPLERKKKSSCQFLKKISIVQELPSN